MIKFPSQSSGQIIWPSPRCPPQPGPHQPYLHVPHSIFNFIFICNTDSSPSLHSHYEPSPSTHIKICYQSHPNPSNWTPPSLFSAALYSIFITYWSFQFPVAFSTPNYHHQNQPWHISTQAQALSPPHLPLLPNLHNSIPISNLTQFIMSPIITSHPPLSPLSWSKPRSTHPATHINPKPLLSQYPVLLRFGNHLVLWVFFIYLLMRDRERERKREREREAETQAEGEAGSMQGARCGTWSWDSRITPWAKGRAKPLSHRGCPQIVFNGIVKYFWPIFNKNKIQNCPPKMAAFIQIKATQIGKTTWNQI